ncbi:uncharacterized protein JCM6883_006988 [Sporobolomyces salmoneus]|uniref:uncharacterized protein n=1 Tax=Sporobolomyces salmoneus TaxID=183962 RepID=UPI00316E4EDB
MSTTSSSPISSSSPAIAQTSSSTASSPPPTATPSTTMNPAKPTNKSDKKKRSRKPVRRRGAKPAADEAEEEEEGSKPVQTGEADDSLSESDFDPDSGREDDPDSEEQEEEEDSDRAPPTAFDQAQEVTPAAWSDMPEAGQAGANSLPELDFAGLSISKLDALPDTTIVNGNGGDESNKGLSKKQMVLQRNLQRSEELREKDPERWEKEETERKERKAAKRSARKEKNKAKKAEFRQKRETEEGTHGIEGTVESTKTHPQPVPARPSRTAVALGLTNSTTDSTSPVASTSRQPPALAPNGTRPNPNRFIRPAPSSSGTPPVDYTRAKEAYTQRLATDPAYIPKVGKFWGHDDRLASPEVRPLNPFWRGGRGGAGGMRGRGGAFRGGRGGAVPRGPDRWTAEGKIVGEEQSEIEKEETEAKENGETSTEEKPKELDPEDKWGRGESKRAQKPSEFASMPGWNHAGFEELEREEQERATRGPSPSTRGSKRGRGGGGPRGGRGGFNQGPPGSINPRYAHLPFHPLHRFPPSTVPSAQTATITSTSTEPQPSTDKSSTGVESTPAAPQITSPSRPANVRLPSSGVAAAQFALAVKEATASRPVQEESVPGPVKAESQAVETPSTAEQSTTTTTTTSPSLELRRQQGASILYAADPSRLADSVSREDAVSPASSFSAYQQQMEPSPLPHNPYQHQLPPHLQSQAPFIPRHSSPSFYPSGPPPPSFYPIDSYGSMPSPSSATPPPQQFSSPPTSSFFLPPRSSRVEIKNPSSPAPPRQTVVSTNNTAYAIASQYHHPQDGSSSPASAHGGVPLPSSSSPSLHNHNHHQYTQNPYSTHVYHHPHGYSQMQPQPQASFNQHLPPQQYEMHQPPHPHQYYQGFQQPPPPPQQSYSYYQQQQQYAPY